MYENLMDYKCHKVVKAAQITAILAGNVLSFGFLGEATVTKEWVKKNNPEVGGYFVVYELQEGETENYTAFSPAAAFESGYTLLADDEAIVLTGGEAAVIEQAGKLTDLEVLVLAQKIRQNSERFKAVRAVAGSLNIG